MSNLVTKAFVEMLGTFIFLSVILKRPEPIPIAVALAAVIYLGGSISGGHFNPAVTFMNYIGNGDVGQLSMYIVAQLLGATLAFYFFKSTKDITE